MHDLWRHGPYGPFDETVHIVEIEICVFLAALFLKSITGA